MECANKRQMGDGRSRAGEREGEGGKGGERRGREMKDRGWGWGKGREPRKNRNVFNLTELLLREPEKHSSCGLRILEYQRQWVECMNKLWFWPSQEFTRCTDRVELDKHLEGDTPVDWGLAMVGLKPLFLYHQIHSFSLYLLAVSVPSPTCLKQNWSFLQNWPLS